MSARKPIVIYDTTLRDGAQGPAVSFSAADKERIARILDGLGFDYVEGGFPGSNPKDEELFAGLAAEPLRHSRLAAFGATRREGAPEPDVRATIGVIAFNWRTRLFALQSWYESSGSPTTNANALSTA